MYKARWINRQVPRFVDRGRGPSSFARMSRLPFELLLALRYLRPKRTFVSVITLISVVGVTLGVAVLIIVISVMSGFDAQLRDKILGFNTHLKVLAREQTMTNYAAVARLVASNRNVRAVAPFVLGPVLVETEPAVGQSQVGAPWIRGIDPRIETNMSVLPNSIVEGKFDVSDRGLLVGTEFARNMGLQVGDRVEIGSPERAEEMAGEHQEGEWHGPGAAGIRGARDLRCRLLRV